MGHQQTEAHVLQKLLIVVTHVSIICCNISFLSLSVRRRKISTVAQLISDHRNATEMTISATTLRRLLQIKDTREVYTFSMSFWIDDINMPFTFDKRAHFRGHAATGFCTLHRRVTFSFENWLKSCAYLERINRQIP